MTEKIKEIKELIADKLKTKIESESLTIEDYDKIAVLLQKLEFISYPFLGVNSVTKTSEVK